MPTLNRRNDGLYFIRHWYGDHHTWQVTSEGVRFLEFRGIMEGDYFSTTLFMEMVVQGLVYTGQGPKVAFRGGSRSASLPEPMFAVVKDFHRALFQGNVDGVGAYLWLPPALGNRADVNKQVKTTLGDPDRRPRSWKLKDAVTYGLPPSERSNFGGADSLTAIRARLDFHEAKVEVTEYWFRTNDKWLVCWGFLPGD